VKNSNNDTDKENRQNKTSEHSQAEPSLTAHGMEYPALFGQVGSACPDVFPPGF